MNEINEVYNKVVQSPNAIICCRITLFLILFQLQNISQRLDASVRFFGEPSYVRTTSDSEVSVDLYLLFSFLFFLCQHKGSTGIVKVRWTSEIK